MLYLGCFIVALLLSSLLARLVRDTALARGWLAAPASQRDVHKVPVPRVGGVAIYLAFLTVLALVVWGWRHYDLSLGFSLDKLLYLLIPATLVFALGLYDDFFHVGPYTKFTVQGIAGLLLYLGGIKIQVLPLLFGNHALSALVTLPLTLLWVLWISNAFNLIDGLDGLSAGSALFSTMVVFVVSLFSGSPMVSLLTAILAGAILGFLRYNFSPATIFLGDCGSLFLGFVLSALALAGAQKGPTVVAVAIPIVSFGLPILDTALSVARRFLSGQPLFRADREHIHHRLLKRGWTQGQAVVVLYGVSAALGLMSLLLLSPHGSSIGVVLAVVGVGVWLGIQHLGYHEFVELRRVAQRTLEQKRAMVNNLAIRRAAEELATARELDEICKILERAFAANDFDSFELGFRSEFELVEELAAPLRRGAAGELRYRWQKPEAEGRNSLVWNVNLELCGARRGQRGTFTLQRAYSDKPLMVDLNLVTTELHHALSNALERATGMCVIELARPGLEGAAYMTSSWSGRVS